MHLLILLNNDIHCAAAINLLLPHIKNHDVKIILSDGVGRAKDFPLELIELKNVEQKRMKELFEEIDSYESVADLGNPFVLSSELVEQSKDERIIAIHPSTSSPRTVANSQPKSETLPRTAPEKKNKFRSFNQIAKIFGSEICIYDNINAQEALRDIKKFSPNLIISIRFGQILKNEIISIPKNGVINLHSGLLPNFRGVMPSFRAVAAGEDELTATLHYICDPKIDEGDIISFSKTKINKNRSLFFNIHKLYEDAYLLIVEHLQKISSNQKIETKKQSDFGKGKYFSYPTSSEIEEFTKLMQLVNDHDAKEIFQKWY